MAENEKAVCANVNEQGKGDEKQTNETEPESVGTLLQDMYVLQKIVSFLKYFGLFLFVWLLGWFGFSCQWVLIAAIGFYVVRTKQEQRDWKQKVGQALAKDEEIVIRARLRDLPSWVSIFLSPSENSSFFNLQIIKTFLVAKRNSILITVDFYDIRLYINILKQLIIYMIVQN